MAPPQQAVPQTLVLPPMPASCTADRHSSSSSSSSSSGRRNGRGRQSTAYARKAHPVLRRCCRPGQASGRGALTLPPGTAHAAAGGAASPAHPPAAGPASEWAWSARAQTAPAAARQSSWRHPRCLQHRRCPLPAAAEQGSGCSLVPPRLRLRHPPSLSHCRSREAGRAIGKRGGRGGEPTGAGRGVLPFPFMLALKRGHS